MKTVHKLESIFYSNNVIVSAAHEYITKVKKIIPDAAMDELVCGNTITFSGVVVVINIFIVK